MTGIVAVPLQCGAGKKSLQLEDDRLAFFRYNKRMCGERGGLAVLEQIMTVAGNEQGQRLLQQLLQEMRLSACCCAETGLEARRQLEKQQFDLVVVNAPLSDEHGEAVARLAFRQGAAVILLVKAEHVDAVWERIGKTGIYMIAKPLKRAVFFQMVQCILVQTERMQQLKAERDRLNRQIQDANLLNRAKLVLIQVLKLSEPQAHHYIEKQAMDLRITKREVAEGIINTYEN